MFLPIYHTLQKHSLGTPEDVRRVHCAGNSVCINRVATVREKSGKISVLVKVSEKSGNFVFRLAQGFVKIMKTFSFGKLSCSGWSGASYVFKCKVFGQWFSL